MANQFASLKALLNADATLTALLTGGIFDDEDTGADGVTHTFAKDNSLVSSSTGELVPFGFIAWSTVTPQALNHADGYGADRFFSVYIYDDKTNGYTTVESAWQRVVKLLNYAVRRNVDTDYSHASRWVDTSPRLRADELFDAALMYVRFEDTYGR